MKKEKSKTYLMKKADKLFSEHWRKEIGHCEKCGKIEGLVIAHIISRGCRKLRYSRDNTFVLCFGCHFQFHRKPLEFQAFVEKVKGKGMSNYLIKSSNVLKPLSNDYYLNVINSIN